jgi:DNA (cytosine-5)-methyltransferase 1
VNVIELFSCSGGMAAGFREAGIDFALAFDHDPNACGSYEKNIGQRPVQMDVRDLLRMAKSGWHPGPLDLIVADPPCAPWSRAGKKKGLDDERDMLAVTVELIGILRPRAYLIGNIPGLQDANAWPTVQKFIGGLMKHGYCAADYACLDAADYGVPQHRVRPYWYGHREGHCLVWPARTHGDPRDIRQKVGFGVEELQRWVTCRQALAGLSEKDLGRLVKLRKQAAKKHGSDERGRRGRTAQSARVGTPDEPAKTLDARPARSGTGDNTVLAWPWDRPSTTVCAAIDKIAAFGEHMGHTGPNAIVLSEKAAAVLQGFPPSWVFSGATKSARWSQIGQAVPPAVAAAIGRAVRRQLEASGAMADVRRTE